MKKVNKDPFSNGTDFDWWEQHNCNRCVKASQPRDGGTRYTNADEYNMPNRCSIQRDIVTRMFSNVPIKQKTIDICEAFIFRRELCPYIKTKRKKYQKKVKNQTTLEL